MFRQSTLSRADARFGRVRRNGWRKRRRRSTGERRPQRGIWASRRGLLRSGEDSVWDRALSGSGPVSSRTSSRTWTASPSGSAALRPPSDERVILLLLRTVYQLSLRRPRVLGAPWPGRAHALLSAAIVEFELEARPRRSLRVVAARVLASMARRITEPVPGATWDAERSRALDLAVDVEDRGA